MIHEWHFGPGPTALPPRLIGCAWWLPTTWFMLKTSCRSIVIRQWTGVRRVPSIHARPVVWSLRPGHLWSMRRRSSLSLRDCFLTKTTKFYQIWCQSQTNWALIRQERESSGAGLLIKRKQAQSTWHRCVSLTNMSLIYDSRGNENDKIADESTNN